MDSITFISSLKNKLIEINMPEEKINRHLTAFNRLFDGKSPSQINAIINSVGGPEGAFRGIYSLEMKKLDNRINENLENSAESGQSSADDRSEEKIEVDSKAFEEAEEEENRQNTEDPVLDSGAEPPVEECEGLNSTVIRDKPNENDLSESEAILESPVEVPDLYTRIKNKIWEIKEDSDEKGDFKYKIFTALIDVAAFPLILILFAAVTVFTLACFIAFFAVLILGFALTVAFVVYGVIELKSSKALALYDLGLGVVIFGATMLSATLLYNSYKRLCPFLFKHLKKLFRTFFEVNGIVFKNTKGE